MTHYTPSSRAAAVDVSVVIPTYNRAETLPRSLISVLCQTVSPKEVIIVDDCSSDETLAVVREFSDSRITFLRTERRSGAPAARNLGTIAATGKWVAFQDSDDCWLPTKLEKQMSLLSSNSDAVLCYTSLLQYYSQRVVLVPTSEAESKADFSFLDLLTSSFISTQTMVIRKDVLTTVGGFREDLRRLQDWELALRLYDAGPFCWVNEPLAIAFHTPGNLTSDIEAGIEARIKILNLHADAFAAHKTVLARHLHILGKQSLDVGKREEAVKFFWQALRSDFFRPNSAVWLTRSLFKRRR